MDAEKARLVGSNHLTQVLAVDDKGEGGANHAYQVLDVGAPNIPNSVLGVVRFQKGGIQDVGHNGLMNEDLLLMVIDRLQGFQSGDFKCRENAIALTKIEEALMWLKKRTQDRLNRGVEGKSVV